MKNKMKNKRWWQNEKMGVRCTTDEQPTLLTENMFILYSTVQMATPPHSQDLLDTDMAHTAARDSANYKVQLISSPFQGGMKESTKNRRCETLLRAVMAN